MQVAKVKALLAVLDVSRNFHTADVNIPSEPAAAGQRDDRAPLETRETTGDRSLRNASS